MTWVPVVSFIWLSLSDHNYFWRCWGLWCFSISLLSRTYDTHADGRIEIHAGIPVTWMNPNSWDYFKSKLETLINEYLAGIFSFYTFVLYLQVLMRHRSRRKSSFIMYSKATCRKFLSIREKYWYFWSRNFVSTVVVWCEVSPTESCLCTLDPRLLELFWKVVET